MNLLKETEKHKGDYYVPDYAKFILKDGNDYSKKQKRAGEWVDDTLTKGTLKNKFRSLPTKKTISTVTLPVNLLYLYTDHSDIDTSIGFVSFAQHFKEHRELESIAEYVFNYAIEQDIDLSVEQIDKISKIIEDKDYDFAISYVEDFYPEILKNLVASQQLKETVAYNFLSGIYHTNSMKNVGINENVMINVNNMLSNA